MIFANHRAVPGPASLSGPMGEKSDAQIRNLRQIRLGRYILNTFRFDTYKPSTVGNCLILGNAAFSQVVLTLDYQKKELIIHTKEYDPTHATTVPGACVLPFTWVNGDAASHGEPMINVQVAGHPAHFILDTGLESVLLLKRYADRCSLAS